MKSLLDVLNGRLIKRGVPVRNLTTGDFEPATGTSVRCTVTLTQGIESDIAKKITRALKDNKEFRKVTASIQGDEIRVSSPSKDELQAVIAFLRAGDYAIELKFGNFRS
jgi:uncharacterized protein YajQ (UPF0234 family)